MFNRIKNARLVLFASPIGALIAGSIFLSQPYDFRNPAFSPIQPIALESGYPAELNPNPIALVQPAAFENAALAEPLPNLALPTLPQAGMESVESLAPSGTPPVKTAAIEPTKPVDTSSRTSTAPLYTAVVEPAKPPKGWDNFCGRYPGECNTKSASPRDVNLTPETWATIVGVNNWANQNIKPMADMKHWGTVNKWYYADDGYGDCKDYVIVKQRKLIEAGLPREALLITIVWTRQNQGHAVLIVRTDKGEFVLDNLSKQVVLWTKAPYDYVKRQARTNSNEWVYIDGPRKQPVMAANDPR